jgi:hypothetical protein
MHVSKKLILPIGCLQPKGSQSVVQMGEEQMSSNVVSFCDTLLLHTDISLLFLSSRTTEHSAVLRIQVSNFALVESFHDTSETMYHFFSSKSCMAYQ